MERVIESARKECGGCRESVRCRVRVWSGDGGEKVGFAHSGVGFGCFPLYRRGGAFFGGFWRCRMRQKRMGGRPGRGKGDGKARVSNPDSAFLMLKFRKVLTV